MKYIFSSKNNQSVLPVGTGFWNHTKRLRLAGMLTLSLILILF